MTGQPLPTGTVTFLFTDIEGSTRLLQELGERYRTVQEDHATILRAAIADGDGVEIRTEGDSFFAVFPTAAGGVRAAVTAQRGLAEHEWSHGRPLRVRMGMHTGTGVLGGDDYLGIDVNRAARIAAAAHGGQVLLSDSTRSLAEQELPEGVALIELGAHRLKDLLAPEHLGQLVIEGLAADFAPVASLETPAVLPAEASSFVGRADELREIGDLVERQRLVTLTGPGGSGKTRLAIRLASDLRDRFDGGVFFVGLSAITEPDLVCPTICRVIGLHDEGTRGAEETLEHFLRPRRALLVLDNFEHLLPASSFVSGLVTACPSLHVLVTSRAVLHLTGEHDVPVAPLGLAPGDGDVASIARSEAVTLFVERARAADPVFALTEENASVVAEICTRLDGLPLAIELAASRVRLLPPAALLERLGESLSVLTAGPRDAPDRQRTLRGAIAWSHELLGEPERALFARLSVFSGGWILDAADEVATLGDDLGDGIIDLLGELVDHSLVRSRGGGTPRFDMLRTIRDFALERLDERGEREAVEERFVARFLALAEDAEPHYRRFEAKEWLDALEAEHENLQAALSLLVERDRGELALRMVAALWRFWHVHGHLTAGRRWAEAALALPSAAGRTLHRARALTGLGGLTYWQFDAPPTRAAYDEAWSIFEELGDVPGMAEGAYNLGFAAGLERDIDGARAMFARSQELFERAGIRRGIADTYWIMALLARIEEDLPTARALAERSLTMHRELEDAFGIVDALEVFGRAAFEMGELDLARSCVLETLDMVEPIVNMTGLAVALDNLAAHANAAGYPERAMRLAGASSAVKEAAGGAAPPQLLDLPDPSEVAGRSLGEEEIAALWEEGRGMSLQEALAYAREDLA
jgi:predicted ATPase/class 3 adenylate cyclase